jgi:hypothetical protein
MKQTSNKKLLIVGLVGVLSSCGTLTMVNQLDDDYVMMVDPYGSQVRISVLDIDAIYWRYYNNPYYRNWRFRYRGIWYSGWGWYPSQWDYINRHRNRFERSRVVPVKRNVVKQQPQRGRSNQTPSRGRAIAPMKQDSNKNLYNRTNRSTGNNSGRIRSNNGVKQQPKQVIKQRTVVKRTNSKPRIKQNKQ